MPDEKNDYPYKNKKELTSQGKKLPHNCLDIYLKTSISSNSETFKWDNKSTCVPK